MEGGEAATVVVRAPNWLGDTVMALPALRVLRDGLPDARLLVVGRWASLLAGQGVADAALSYPAGLAARLRFVGHLRASGPELAIILPNSLESALAARWSGALRRVGFAADGRDRLLTDPVPLPAPRMHQVDEYALLVEALGFAVADRVPRWQGRGTPADDADVQALLARVDRGGSSRLVGLHLGAAVGSSKLWPAGSFARLAGRLRRAGLVPVLLGSGADAGTAAAVLSDASVAIPSLVGRDRPALLPGLLSGLGCLVSGDTGVAHLAAALGVPTVTLFGPTDPGRTAPRGAGARAVVGSAPCAPCFLPTCPIDHVCLRDVAVTAVASQVMEAVA
jgi:heptosyltransferase-2